MEIQIAFRSLQMTAQERFGYTVLTNMRFIALQINKWGLSKQCFTNVELDLSSVKDLGYTKQFSKLLTTYQS